MIPGFYDNRSGLVIFCITLCLVVSTAMVSMRIWTRKFIINQMGPDDWVAIIAMVITWGEGIIIGISTQYGLGKHIFAVQPPTLIPTYWKTFWVTLLLYHAGLCAAKMTFLIQYYRIFAVALPRMRLVYIGAIVLVGAWSFAQVLIALLICRPIQGLWDLTIKADCMPNSPQIYVNAGGNIITDILIFVLPLPAIRTLNLRKRQKLVLLGIFSLGFFTVAISVIRIKYLEIGSDVTWQHVESSGWSIGELTCAITCASLPTLRPFMAKYFPVLGFHSSSIQDSAAPSYKPPTIGGTTGRGNESTVHREYNKMDEDEDEEYELGAARSRSTIAARRNSGGEVSTITDEEMLLGMKPTTKTRIEGRAAEANHVRANGEQGQDGGHGQIQVMRAVYQSSNLKAGGK
ncbi:hypothetical protein QBC37DRAFT_296316 [Rhypophila decipiens]|uniref:Rhodopsin domain-containing protein n=1 Tax=Rhypophila decipiens TaxID=261697 RepID=A0AAN7B3I6_9PEZI|nr:hypothetical protein QBC37DRAFT_296316 [Rhypophila decipiens]